MRISLFIPCFVDQMSPRTGVAVVEVLERLGHEVLYPEGQTCCGQPAFNSGFCDQARCVAEHFLDTFADAEHVVVPSGSCAAMVKVFYPELFQGTKRAAEAKALGERTWEFSQFLVEKLGVGDVGASFAGKVTFHDGCHGLRELGVHAAPRTLLRHVRGLELVEMGEARTCCGFGGTFAVKFPEISTAMAQVKCNSIIDCGAHTVVSNDPSCLMQIRGYFDKHGNTLPCLHLAEVLART
ncbi:MAG: (Fe-S)-binding protein [Planctomycetes bacterium]|nr:(Fe-S)-binding protein [Planctomycetota bacterium]